MIPRDNLSFSMPEYHPEDASGVTSQLVCWAKCLIHTVLSTRFSKARWKHRGLCEWFWHWTSLMVGGDPGHISRQVSRLIRPKLRPGVREKSGGPVTSEIWMLEFGPGALQRCLGSRISVTYPPDSRTFSEVSRQINGSDFEAFGSLQAGDFIAVAPFLFLPFFNGSKHQPQNFGT